MVQQAEAGGWMGGAYSRETSTNRHTMRLANFVHRSSGRCDGCCCCCCLRPEEEQHEDGVTGCMLLCMFAPCCCHTQTFRHSQAAASVYVNMCVLAENDINFQNVQHTTQNIRYELARARDTNARGACASCYKLTIIQIICTGAVPVRCRCVGEYKKDAKGCRWRCIDAIASTPLIWRLWGARFSKTIVS